MLSDRMYIWYRDQFVMLSRIVRTKLCVDLSVSTLDFDNYPSTPKPSSSRQELFVLAAKLILCWPFHDLMSLIYYALKLSHKILKIVLTV